jgi:hypothetical protein
MPLLAQPKPPSLFSQTQLLTKIHNINQSRSCPQTQMKSSAALIALFCWFTAISHVNPVAAQREAERESSARSRTKVARTLQTGGQQDWTRFGIGVELSNDPGPDVFNVIDLVIDFTVEQYIKGTWRSRDNRPAYGEPIESSTRNEPDESDSEDDEGVDERDEHDGGEGDSEDGEDEDGSEDGGEGGEDDSPDEEDSEDNPNNDRRLQRKVSQRWALQRSESQTTQSVGRSRRSLSRFQCTSSVCSVIGCPLCVKKKKRVRRRLQSPATTCFPRSASLEDSLARNLGRACTNNQCGGAIIQIYAFEVPAGSLLEEISAAEVCP